MRKYRAWDKKLKMMDYDTLPGNLLCALHNPGDWDEEDEKRYILMQYTGLKDKDGKEIYEGDICRVSSDTFYSNSYATLEESWELMMQVVFCNYAFIFRCLQDKHLEILLAETLWEDFEIEIVGNIYENLELINAHSK